MALICQTDSRIADGTRSWEELCDTDVTGYLDPFILATFALDNTPHSGTTATFKLQWRRAAGTFADVGADTEVCWATGADTVLVDATSPVGASSGCQTPNISIENEGDNACAPAKVASGAYLEVQWGLKFGSGAQDSQEYEFQLYNTTDDGTAICSVSITTGTFPQTIAGVCNGSSTVSGTISYIAIGKLEGSTYNEASENFNDIANGNLHADANWTQVTDIFTVAGTGDKYVYISTLDSESGVLHEQVLADDQFAKCVFKTTPPVGNEIGPAVRMSGSGATANYYACIADSSTCYLGKLINDAWTALDSDPTPISAGDVLELRVVGDQLSAYKNGSIISGLGTAGYYTDTSHSSGKAGIAGWDGDAGAQVDDFVCGGFDVSTVTGNLGEASLDALAGVVNTASSVTGDILGRIDISGEINTASSVTGDILGRINISGEVNTSSSVAGDILGRIDISGTTNGVATVDGAVKGTGNIDGSSDGVATVDGTMVQPAGELAGTSDGVTTVDGTIKGTGSIAGVINGGATVDGVIKGTGEFAGESNGVASVTGTMVQPELAFLLTSTGDGTGVSTLKMTSSEDTLLTLDGTAKFYSDAGGTQDESSTWTVLTGAERTRYIKCPSSTANFYIEKDTITSWGQWASSTNAASLSGDISQLTVLTYMYLAGLNAISGDVSTLLFMAFIAVGGNNTLSGSISGMTLLTYLSILGSNTLSGDVSLISAGLTRCYISGLNQIVTYTAGGDWSSISEANTVCIVPTTGYGLSSAEVDLLITEVESTRTADRAIDITLTGSNEFRTTASNTAVADIISDGGSVTVNGVLGVLAGVINGVATVTGTMVQPAGELAGTSDGVTTVSGTLKGTGELIGISDGIVTISGILKGQGELVGEITGVASVSGTISGETSISGEINGIASVQVTIQAVGDLAGEINGVASLSATIQAAGALAGIVNTSSSVTGTSQADGKLVGVINTASTVTGMMITDALIGTSIGISTVIGTIRAVGALSSEVSTSSLVTGTMQATVAISGIVNAFSTVTGIIKTHALVGTSTGASTVTGTMQAIGVLSGVLNASSTVTGIMLTDALLGVSNGTSVVTGVVLGIGKLIGVINTASSVIGDVLGKINISGIINAFSNVTGIVRGFGVLVGAINTSSNVTGDLVGAAASALVGIINGSSTTLGTLIAKGEFVGVISTSSALVGSLRGGINISGEANGLTSTQAILLGGGTLGGISDCTSAIAGTVLAQGAMASAVEGVAIVTGTITYVGADLVLEIIFFNSLATVLVEFDSPATVLVEFDSVGTIVEEFDTVTL